MPRSRASNADLPWTLYRAAGNQAAELANDPINLMMVNTK
jgi:hypothetical protein